MITLLRSHASFMGRTSLQDATTLTSLGTMSTGIEEMFCHMNSRERMFKGLCRFMGGSPLQRVKNVPCLVAIGLVQVEI